MNLSYILLLKGFTVGFLVAAPIGPIAILCIRQTVAYGFWIGMASALGASIADAMYSTAAALGASSINHIFQEYAQIFYCIGGAFLLYIGGKVFITKIAEVKTEKETSTFTAAFFYTFVLTFMSPMTTLLFITMFSNSGVFEKPLFTPDIVSLSFGVFCGAMVWWIILCGSVAKIYQRFKSVAVFQLVNKLSGIAIMCFALFTLTKVIWPEPVQPVLIQENAGAVNLSGPVCINNQNS
jgi:threonine/homoserine/homoserine lactone efflux protein